MMSTLLRKTADGSINYPTQRMGCQGNHLRIAKSQQFLIRSRNFLLLGMFFCVVAMLNACSPKGQISAGTSGVVSGKICYPSDSLPAMNLYFESTSDDLPEQIKESIIQPEEPQDSGNDLWTVYEDPHYGVRFAVPCFWEVNFPHQYHRSGTAYPLRNYSEAFSMSFGKNHNAVWENGGIKIDMNFASGEIWGLSADATLQDYPADNHTGPESGVETLSSEEVLINGQKGLLVTTKDRFGIYSYYLFEVSENIFLSFEVYPPQAIDNPDVQGILHSLAFSPDVAVAIPKIMPGDSPQGDQPACLQPIE